MAHRRLTPKSLFGHLLRRRDNSVSDDVAERRPTLTRSDQSALALVALLALTFMSANWLASGALNGGLVDIDSAEPLHATFQTDINSADWTELMQLPDIGESLAKRIVESRERQGRFTSHDDLDRVRGIGPKTLDRIRPYLRPLE
jgi:competence protein ComEA